MALQIGASGSQVRQIQQALLQRGFDPQGIDGSFGTNTDSAVRAFQRASHLQVDGRVGTQTLQALRNRDTFTPSPSTSSTTTGANRTTTAGSPTTHVNVPWYSQFEG